MKNMLAAALRWKMDPWLALIHALFARIFLIKMVRQCFVYFHKNWIWVIFIFL